MIEEFIIDGVVLTAELDPLNLRGRLLQSVPFPYKIEWLDNVRSSQSIRDETSSVD